jgi:hypothetical protein
MAVLDGILGLVGLAPELIHAVAELAMSDDRTVMRRGGSGLCEQARRRHRSNAAGEEGTSGERVHCERRWKMDDER